MEAPSLMAIAAASDRVAYVYLVNGQLKRWQTSGKAAQSTNLAAEVVQGWINRCAPGVVVTERLGPGSAKGVSTQKIIAAVARTAAHNYVLDVSVDRAHDYANKYVEAASLVERYPELRAWLPRKRACFENEPHNIVLFEALSLADRVQRGGPTLLGAAMG